MGKLVILNIELKAIQNFLDRVIADVSEEFRYVHKNVEDGHFHDIDDYYNALYHPEQRLLIGTRAVYYEITALVEHELQSVAIAPWYSSTDHSGPKSISQLASLKDIRKLKQISDLPYYQIVKLVEDYYKIKLVQLPGGKHLVAIRETVNAFKHRKGRKDIRKLNKPALEKLLSPIEYYKTDYEDAYKAINNARTFLLALWDITNPKHSHDYFIPYFDEEE